MSYVAPKPPSDFFKEKSARHSQSDGKYSSIPPKLMKITRVSSIHGCGSSSSSGSGHTRDDRRRRDDHRGSRDRAFSPPRSSYYNAAPAFMSTMPPVCPPEPTRVWPVPENILDCSVESCAMRDASDIGMESAVDRRKRIALQNNMNYETLESTWIGDRWNVRTDLFNPEGFPNFLLNVDVWKPLLETYFHWFCIPRSACTRVWEEIVDNLLKIPKGMGMDVPFQAWAFGCLCKFHLEDRKMEIRREYDPQHPSM